MVHAFEGNKAETTTMLLVIEAFMEAHRLPRVTVVADAGMVTAVNQKAIEERPDYSKTEVGQPLPLSSPNSSGKRQTIRSAKAGAQ